MNLSFLELNKSIIKCSKCPRLVKFRKKISSEKRKQYKNENYWGRPITGFGDVDGKILFTGKVNKDIEIPSAVKAAELCMLNSFAILKDAIQNNLNLVRKCVKINVFINSDDLFINQPEVADGASNLITKIMNPNSDHARSAVSVNSLPKNATVEIDSVFEIAVER